VYDYGPGQYLIASVDLPVTGHYTLASPAEPALGFGMILRPSAVASLLLEAPAGAAPPPGRPTTAAPGIGVADASPELLDAVVRLVRLLDSPDDRHVLAASIEREVLWRLLTGPLGATAWQIGLSDSTLMHIGRAVRWITDHYNVPFRIEALADSCALSPSAFHRNFRAVTALSPIQFQKQIRLQQSRLLLLAGDEDVATVGRHVGYDNTSQFSREYRRQFGLPPGRDAARLRSASYGGGHFDHASAPDPSGARGSGAEPVRDHVLPLRGAHAPVLQPHRAAPHQEGRPTTAGAASEHHQLDGQAGYRGKDR
jgi:AraC-like DNA-binding protein